MVMNLFNKIKKANFIVCALAAVSYMNSASAVSFEARDWENPDEIGRASCRERVSSPV